MAIDLDPGLMSGADAARALGLTRQRVYQLATSGSLTSARVAGHRLFDTRDVARLAAEREAITTERAARGHRAPGRPAAAPEAA